LCDYEKKEILDYPSVYFIGAKSKKKMASPDNSTNNYSYDDDRGDYQVIMGDHLAYRYEVVDTLGKGSFGQVLNCRDHCTGQSVAVKIIRNKKRFHHQALVEIKILDNLRKWVRALLYSSATFQRVTSIEGCGRKTLRSQDDRAFLFPQPPVHCDRVAEHQPLRADQGEWLRWVYDRPNSSVHQPDAHVFVVDAASSHRALRLEARGMQALPTPVSDPHSL
jgi:Protein kinase domain